MIKKMLLGLCFLGVILTSLIDAPMDLEKVLWLPSLNYPFGYDEMGRNYFIILSKGSVLTFFMGSLSLITAVLMTLIFMVTVFIIPKFKFLLMRVIELLDALPTFLWVFLILNLLGSNLNNEVRILLISILIGLFGSSSIYRKVNFLWQQVLSENYVQGVIAVGASTSYLMRRHLMPRMAHLCWPIFIYYWTVFLLTESFVSFLGYGIRPPLYSLGSLLNKGWQYFYTSTHLLILPGLILTLVFLFVRFKLRALKLRGPLKAQETDQ